MTLFDKLKAECKKAGYVRLVTQVTLYATTGEGYGHVEGLFYITDTNTKKEPTVDNWPAIWDIVEKLGISSGCGNGGTGVHQYQIRIPTSLMADWPVGIQNFELRRQNPKRRLGSTIFIGR